MIEINKIKLFPIPYAGASVNVYFGWKKLLPNRYELCLNELAGRGGRFAEPYYQSLDEASDDIVKRVIGQLDFDDEYVIFGHSMGALLAYEVYYKLNKIGVKLPKHLFFSGRNAPHVIEKKEDIENMDNETFLKLVEQFGGIPKEFYTKEIMELFLPILRADFTLLNNYKFQPKVDKIRCGVSVFYGVNDFSVRIREIEKWSEVVEADVKFHEFKGGHFFLNEYTENVVDYIVRDIDNWSIQC